MQFRTRTKNAALHYRRTKFQAAIFFLSLRRTSDSAESLSAFRESEPRNSLFHFCFLFPSIRPRSFLLPRRSPVPLSHPRFLRAAVTPRELRDRQRPFPWRCHNLRNCIILLVSTYAIGATAAPRLVKIKNCHQAPEIAERPR